MKTIQAVLLRLLGLLVLGGGVVLLGMWFDFGVYRHVVAAFKEHFATPWGCALGAVCVVLGLASVLPWKRVKHSKNTISFPGMHGDVTIELDSVEATLGRVLGRKPEVKKIKVKVTPSEDNHRAVVCADVLMQKDTGTEGAREIANRIANYLADAAVHILGVEEVLKVDLNVRDIIVDAKQLSVALDREALARTEEPAAAPPVAATVPVAAEVPSVSAPDAAAEALVTEAPASVVEETGHSSLLDQWVPVEPEQPPAEDKDPVLLMDVVGETPSPRQDTPAFELEQEPEPPVKEGHSFAELGGLIPEREEKPVTEPENKA